MGDASQIFISYSRREHAFVGRLERTIAQWGMRPWVDRQRLAGGQQWSDELERAIQASVALVLVLTPAALDSQTVQREYHTALSQNIPVIVAWLRPVTQVPPELARLPQIDFTSHKARAEERLFLALYDGGIRPTDPDPMPGESWTVPLILANHDRMPPGWKRYTVPRSLYVSVSIVYSILIVLALAIMFVPGSPFSVWQADHPAASFSQASAAIGSVMLTMMACFFVLRVIGFYTGYLIAFALRLLPPDQLVLTPDGVAMNLFHRRFARIGVEQLYFPFAGIQRAEQRRTRLGNYRLTMVSRVTGEVFAIVIPRRIRHADDAVALICAAVEHNRLQIGSQLQEHPHNREATPASAEPVQQASLSGMARPCGYAIAADSAGSKGIDSRLLSAINAALTTRGLVLLGMRPMSSGEWIDSASALQQATLVLFPLAPAILHSPDAERLLTALLAQGRTVIPLLIEPLADQPAFVAHVQWVDCTRQVARERSICDLLDAVNALGVPLTPPGPLPDRELVLARTMHDRIPSEWRAFQPVPQVRAVYQVSYLTRITNFLLGTFLSLNLLLVVALVWLSLSLLAVTLLINAGIIGEDLPQGGWAIAILMTYALSALVTGFVVWFAIIRPLRRSFVYLFFYGREYRRLARGFAVPEMLVVTPEGVVVHTVDPRRQQFSDYVLPFARMQGVHARSSRYSPVRLTSTVRGGKAVRFDVPRYLVNVERIADTIKQMRDAYLAQVR